MGSLNRFYEKYAKLIVTYCINVQKKETILVQSTPIAEPLLKPLYKAILEAGGHCEFLLKFDEQEKIFFDYSNIIQLLLFQHQKLSQSTVNKRLDLEYHDQKWLTHHYAKPSHIVEVHGIA